VETPQVPIRSSRRAEDPLTGYLASTPPPARVRRTQEIDQRSLSAPPSCEPNARICAVGSGSDFRRAPDIHIACITAFVLAMPQGRGYRASCLAPETPELLLASRHDQLAASVERFLLTEDIGSHRLTSARFRLRCPPRVARLLRSPKRHAYDLLLVIRPVREGARHAVWMCARAAGAPLELCQRVRLEPARGRPGEVLLGGGLLQDWRGGRRRPGRRRPRPDYFLPG
jgi:hypothetical protein